MKHQLDFRLAIARRAVLRFLLDIDACAVDDRTVDVGSSQVRTIDVRIIERGIIA